MSGANINPGKTTMDPTAIIRPSASLARASGRENLGRFLPNSQLKLREQLARCVAFGIGRSGIQRQDAKTPS